MATVHSIMDQKYIDRFEIWAQFAQVILVIPHSNVDPEHFFSMVRKIETEEIQQLDPSTVCDVKINRAIQLNI